MLDKAKRLDVAEGLIRRSAEIGKPGKHSGEVALLRDALHSLVQLQRDGMMAPDPMLNGRGEDVTQLMADLQDELKREREFAAGEREQFSKRLAEMREYTAAAIEKGAEMHEAIIAVHVGGGDLVAAGTAAIRWQAWREAVNV